MLTQELKARLRLKLVEIAHFWRRFRPKSFTDPARVGAALRLPSQ
jgi:hypothetical protein